MKLRTFTTAAVPVAVAVALGSGTVHADPVAPPESTVQTAPATPAAPVAPDVHYRIALKDNVIETALDSGTFRVAGDQRTVDILDAAGGTLVTLPLSFRQDGLEYQLPHRISDDGRTLGLTAVKDAATARPAPVAATPVASALENERALDAFNTQLSVATGIGTLLGTALGAVAGLIGIVGGVTVVASVITGATLGGIIGTLVVGGPALMIAGIDLAGTFIAPAGTTKWQR
ncbi:ammonium transporter [Nocardia sp. BMG111209]|uniref:ammonium transporter n=1 Tax=Nocardia sp. BMG111209 TaxID=1160137 RepID=UPI00037E010D|nr:ammonium transporter [Nocardia sp. BMG111209]